MAWTSPKTWTSEPLLATDLNTHLRDNLNALKAPPTSTINPASDVAFSSTSWAVVSTSNWRASITTTGGDVLVIGNIFIDPGTVTSFLWLDIAVDGTRDGDTTEGVAKYVLDNTNIFSLSFVYLIESVSSGAHNFDLYAKVSANTHTFKSTYGTLTVREV